MHMFNKKTIISTQNNMEFLTYFLCFITLVIAVFDNNLSLKLFNITAALAILTLIIKRQTLHFELKTVLLPVAIITIGIINLGWYSIFKQNDIVFRSTYHSYLNTAKVFILGSFILLLALSSKLELKKVFFLYLIATLTLIVAAISIYKKIVLNIPRLDLGIGSATGAAYTITIIGLISGYSILQTAGKLRLVLYLSNFIIIFLCLLFTETRAAILVYPVLMAITIFISYRKNIKHIIYFTSSIILLAIFCGAIFNETITARYNAAMNDIAQYKAKNSVTSVGARFAMYSTGWDTFLDKPLTGHSVEARAKHIRSLATKDHSLNGALPFLNVHMHNEIIEAASLKGILGIISTLFLYATLLFTSCQYKNIGLLSLAIALIGYGLSDVLLWSRSIPLIFILAITIVLVIHRKTLRPEKN